MTKNRYFILLAAILLLSKYLFCQDPGFVKNDAPLVQLVTTSLYEFNYSNPNQNDCSDVNLQNKWGDKELTNQNDKIDVCNKLVYYYESDKGKTTYPNYCVNEDPNADPVCSYYKKQFKRLSAVDNSVLQQMSIDQAGFNNKYRSIKACTWQVDKCVSINNAALDPFSREQPSLNILLSSDVISKYKTEFTKLVDKNDAALSALFDSIKKYRELKDDTISVSEELKKDYAVNVIQVGCNHFDLNSADIIDLIVNQNRTTTSPNPDSYCKINVVSVTANPLSKKSGEPEYLYVYNDNYMSFVKVTKDVERYTIDNTAPKSRYDGFCADKTPSAEVVSDTLSALAIINPVVQLKDGSDKTFSIRLLPSNKDFPGSMEKLAYLMYTCPPAMSTSVADSKFDSFRAGYNTAYDNSLQYARPSNPNPDVSVATPAVTQLGLVLKGMQEGTAQTYRESKFYRILSDINGANISKAYKDKLREFIGENNKIPKLGQPMFFMKLASNYGATIDVKQELSSDKDEWALLSNTKEPVQAVKMSSPGSTGIQTMTPQIELKTIAPQPIVIPDKPAKAKGVYNDKDPAKQNKLYELLIPSLDAQSEGTIVAPDHVFKYISDAGSADRQQANYLSTALNTNTFWANTMQSIVANPYNYTQYGVTGNGVPISADDRGTKAKGSGGFWKFLGSDATAKLGMMALSYYMTDKQSKLDSSRIKAQLEMEAIKARMNQCSSMDCKTQQDLCLAQQVPCRTNREIIFGWTWGKKDDMCTIKDLEGSDQYKKCTTCDATYSDTQPYFNPYTNETKQMTLYQICLMNVTNSLLNRNKCFDLMSLNAQIPGSVTNNDIRNCFLGLTATRNNLGITYPNLSNLNQPAAATKAAEDKKKDAASTAAPAGSGGPSSPGAGVEKSKSQQPDDSVYGKYNKEGSYPTRFTSGSMPYGTPGGSYNAGGDVKSTTGLTPPKLEAPAELKIIELMNRQRRITVEKTTTGN